VRPNSTTSPQSPPKHRNTHVPIAERMAVSMPVSMPLDRAPAIVPEELATASPRPTNDTTAAPAAAPDVRRIATERITPSRANVPHRDPDPELIESVRERGVIEAIMVRPIPPAVLTDAAGAQREVEYELVFGERRWKANRAAGHETIVAEVRVLTDQEALDVQTEENLHRENLSPLQEAAVFDAYRVRFSAEPADIARRVHKTERYVVQRLKLLDLLSEAQEALAAGRIVLGTAIEIACLPDPKDRGEALDLVLPRDGGGALSARDARERIARKFHLRMANARFDVADATLVPAAGSCLACPKRSSNQLALCIDGLEPEDRCTDVACFQAKTTAVWERRKAAATAEGLRVLDTATPGKEGQKAREMIVIPSRHGLIDLDAHCPLAQPDESELVAAEGALDEAEASGDEGAIAAAKVRLERAESEYTHQDQRGRTWRDVLGDAVGSAVKPVAVGREVRSYDPNDKIVELVDERTALQAAKERGVQLPDWAASKLAATEPEQPQRPAADDAAIVKGRIERRTEELFDLKLVEQLVAIAEGTAPRPGPDFWRGLVIGLVKVQGLADGLLEQICERRSWAKEEDGLDADSVILAAAGKLSEAQLRGLVVELLCAGDFGDPLHALVAHFKIDLKRTRAAASKAAKAEVSKGNSTNGAGKRANGKSTRTVEPTEAKCRKCGCTDSNACEDPGDGLPCSWVEPDLCSACAGTRNPAKAGKANKKPRGRAAASAEVSS
jgi:ParB/RepB/Spo0J family partition protein